MSSAPHPGEHLAHPAMAAHVHVVDEVRAGQHPGNDPSGLHVRVGTHRQMLLEEVVQPSPSASRITGVVSGMVVLDDVGERVLLSQVRSPRDPSSEPHNTLEWSITMTADPVSTLSCSCTSSWPRPARI